MSSDVTAKSDPASADTPDAGARLDELLPVTSMRLWLLGVAAALVIGALVAYAAVTPRNVTVETTGRVVGNNGIGLVTSTAAGQFGAFTLKSGTKVKVGDKVAEVITATGAVPQYTQVDGVLLGYLPSAGAPIALGEWIAQVSMNVDDGRMGLIAVLPEEAAKIAEGMPVTISVVTGQKTSETFEGRIGELRSPVFAPDIVQEGMGTIEPPSGPRVVIEVVLDEVAPGGYEFDAVVMVSERTLLQQLLGLS